MSSIIPLRYVTLSRTEKDWTCGRARYWAYEYLGRGLSKAGTAQNLFIGSTLHDTLAVIATRYKDGIAVNIDEIASTAYAQMYEALVGATEKRTEEDSITYAKEQATLVEGLVRGYYKHVWPRLLAKYPTIIGVEMEATYKMTDEIVFVARPDLIMADAEGNWHYCEFKSTSSKKEEWVNSWDTAVQLHSSIRAVHETFGVEPVDVTIVGFYKGYVSYGRQNSPFCLAPSTKILTSNLNWVALDSIKEGDHIAGFDEDVVSEPNRSPSRYWRDAQVKKIGKIRLPSLKLKLSDGTSVVCSKDHQWLITQLNTSAGAETTQWRAADTLRDKITFPTTASRILKLTNKWEPSYTYEAGYLSGILDGEGSIAHIKASKKEQLHTVLGFSQKPGKIMDNVSKALRNYSNKIYGPYIPYGSRSAGHLSISNRVDILNVLGTIRPERLITNLDLNRFGSIRSSIDPVTVLEIEDVGEVDLIMIETSTKTLVAEGLASHNCYGYKKSGNPPFTKDIIQYEYKAGFKKLPVWEVEGASKAWIDAMPESVLVDQFPMTPPIFINDEMIDSFFKQRTLREQEIAAYDPDNQVLTLDKVFPQRYVACSPAWGFGCEYKTLCFGHVTDPTQEGYELRVPHIEAERRQMGLTDDTDEIGG